MKLRYVPIAVFLLLVVAFALNHAYWAYKVSVERDKLRALGYPATKEEFAAWYALPNGEENAAELYAQAVRSDFAPSITRRLPASGSAEFDWRDPMPPEVFEETRRFVESNRDRIELLKQAASIPVYRSMVDLNQNRWQLHHSALEKYSHYRSLARLLADYSFYLRDTDDADNAVQLLRAQFGLGRALFQDFESVAPLVAIALDGIALASTTHLLTIPSLTDDHLVRFDSIVADEMHYRTLDHYMLSEVCLQLRSFDVMANQPRAFVNWTLLTKIDGWELPYGALTAHDNKDLHQMLSMAQWYFGMPTALAVDKPFAPLPLELEAEPMIGGTWFGRTDIAFPVVTHTRRLRLKMHSARIAVAVERHRIRNDALPEALGAMESYLLSVGTTDPYSDESLRYAVDGDNYWIYSVGPNGRDDGGYDPVADQELGDDIAVAVIRSVPVREPLKGADY